MVAHKAQKVGGPPGPIASAASAVLYINVDTFITSTSMSLCLHSEPVILMLLLVSLACDDAKIRIWTIPEDGLDGTLTEPSLYLTGS